MIADTSHEHQDAGFYYEGDNVVLTWGGYEYEFPLSRLSTPDALLGFIAHISEKEWEGMTPYRLREFVISVYKKNGWGFPSGD